MTRISTPPPRTPALTRTHTRVAERVPTPGPAPARPKMSRNDSRDSEIMREIERSLYGPAGRQWDDHTWVDTFMEKGWPKIKLKWAAFKAKFKWAKPA